MRVDLILTSDWHLREDQPTCRTDDYQKAQAKKVKFMRVLQEEFECPIIVAGDLLDTWHVSPYFEGWLIRNLPKRINVIQGQHDLKQHNLALHRKTSLNVLESAGVVKVLKPGRSYATGQSTTLYAYPYGTALSGLPRNTRTDRRIAVCHTLAYYKKKPFPGAPSEGNAFNIMKKLKGFDLIVTGDNHQPFSLEHKGQLMVNCGSLMRMDANQGNYKPRVYLWNAKTNKKKTVYLPIKENVVSREHIEEKEERDERVEAFVKRLRKDCEIGFSFRKNLKEFFDKNKTANAVTSKVWEMLE